MTQHSRSLTGFLVGTTMLASSMVLHMWLGPSEEQLVFN